jgi:hypothetical protein
MRQVAFALLSAGFLSCVSDPAAPPASIRLEGRAEEPVLRFLAPGPEVAASLAPGRAGRLTHYSLGGEEILFQSPDGRGNSGFGLDLGPEPRTVPLPHPEVDRKPYEWAKVGDQAVTVMSSPSPALGVRVHRQVSIDARTGALSIVSRLKNVSGQAQSWCFWDRTLAAGGGYTIIPLNPASRFRAKWVLGRRNAKRLWDYDGESPAHDNCRILDGMLVVRSVGPETKVGADSQAGWMAYVRGDLLLVKYYAYDPKGNYTDSGLSVAHYFNQSFAELEPLSPEASLPPGGEYVFPERWTLRRLRAPVTSFDEARAAASEIPPSPLPH